MHVTSNTCPEGRRGGGALLPAGVISCDISLRLARLAAAPPSAGAFELAPSPSCGCFRRLQFLDAMTPLRWPPLQPGSAPGPCQSASALAICERHLFDLPQQGDVAFPALSDYCLLARLAAGAARAYLLCVLLRDKFAVFLGCDGAGNGALQTGFKSRASWPAWQYNGLLRWAVLMQPPLQTAPPPASTVLQSSHHPRLQHHLAQSSATGSPDEGLLDG
jgi:hypothetical protein